MTVRIVTDSTADIPSDVAKSLDITVVPLSVRFGSESFKDGVEISSDQFFEKLQKNQVLPKTSQPSVGEFLEMYSGFARDQIVSIHVAQQLSGTFNSATVAAQLAGAERIAVVDSRLVSMGLGMVVIETAKKTNAGMGFREASQYATDCIKRVHCLLTLDTLEYLQKGGRIGKAQAFLGSTLGIRPLLSVKDGEVHPVERLRTRAKAIERVLELTNAIPKASRYYVMHSVAQQDAETVAKRLRDSFPGKEVGIGKLGPVIGVYAGPGTVGVATLEAE
ncbi:MAG: DegV family protein [Dehalococcoidia bacterium]|nr:DegV family protein [Dehalococcoidia bacterium]